MNHFVGCINEMYYGLCSVLFTAGAIGGLSERYRPRHLRILSDVLRLR